MKLLKPKILRFESLPSTNTELARRASEGAEEGLSIVADEQTAGRGRLQRMWSSPKGAGLYFSILLRPTIAQDRWPLITFMASLAVADALYEASGITADIKWPNDLLSGERKICGILAEAIETPAGRAVVVGIGINLTAEAYPPDLSNVASSIAEAAGRSDGRAAERETILAGLQNALARWYSLLHEPDGAERIVAAWTSRSSYASGRLVTVANGDEVWQGITRGIESDGALRFETETGEIRFGESRRRQYQTDIMSDRKRIVLNTFGSFGDVHPYMALGVELRRRGHAAVIATMEIYREKVENAGLEFAPVRPNIPQPKEQDEELIRKIMEPRTGPQFLMEEIVFPAVRDAYQDLLVAIKGADLLVTHPAAPAGPLIGRKTGMPWISTVLAPLSFFSVYDPPIPPVMQWTTRVFSLLGPRFLKLFFDAMKREYKRKTSLSSALNLD